MYYKCSNLLVLTLIYFFFIVSSIEINKKYEWIVHVINYEHAIF
jgi:hypothetical protein